MITLAILLIIWGIYCGVSIQRQCVKTMKPFNSDFVGETHEWTGLIVGAIVAGITIVSLCIAYLP